MSEGTRVFKASRFTSGNLIFPVRIEITADRVTRVKPRFFGRSEESIAIAKVASVAIDSGVFFADIRIDSSGGTNPITSYGHWKGDAREIRELIEGYQRARP